MSITLSSVDFVQPDGELSGYLFPENNMDDLLAGWLAKAAELVVNVPTASQNDAAEAWVYYRAYTLVADRLSLSPATIMVDGQVTRTTAADQRKYFADRAKVWLDLYYGFNTTEVGSVIPAFFSTVKARRPNVYTTDQW